MAPAGKKTTTVPASADVVRGRGCPRISIRLSEEEYRLLEAMKQYGVSNGEALRVGLEMLERAAQQHRKNPWDFVKARRAA